MIWTPVEATSLSDNYLPKISENNYSSLSPALKY